MITPVVTTENIEKIKDLTQLIFSSIFIEIAVPPMINKYTHPTRSGTTIMNFFIKRFRSVESPYKVVK